MPAWAHRRSSIWAMPRSVIAPLDPSHSAGKVPRGWREQSRMYLSRDYPVLAPKATRRGRRPLPTTGTTSSSKSTSSTLSPATSPRQQPLSMKVRSRATSRRSLNVGPSHALSSFRMSSSETTDTGTSGTAGGFMRTVGSVAISPSSANHLNNCWRLRYLTAAVDGFQRPNVAAMNVSMWSRVMLAPTWYRSCRGGRRQPAERSPRSCARSWGSC